MAHDMLCNNTNARPEISRASTLLDHSSETCISLQSPVQMTIRLPIRRTTVDIGRAFELHCLRFLQEQMYMELTQVGGAGDGGVDLRGWWTVPRSPSSDGSASRRLRVLGQCKAERKALGPRIVRELEGVMAHQRGMPFFQRGIELMIRSRDTRYDSDPLISIWFLPKSNDSRNSLLHTSTPSSPTWRSVSDRTRT